MFIPIIKIEIQIYELLCLFFHLLELYLWKIIGGRLTSRANSYPLLFIVYCNKLHD